MTRDEQIEEARRVANEIRSVAPEKAAQIDQAIDDLLNDKRESLTVTATAKVTLEKFDGDVRPDSVPVETVVTEGNL